MTGAWWTEPVHREYHFADFKHGDAMWVYYHGYLRHWFWQGLVE